jgi:hypothetical protein
VIHVVGVKAHRHVEFEVGDDLATVGSCILKASERSDVRKPHVAIASVGEDCGPQQGLSSAASSTYRIRALQPIDFDGISRVRWRACRTAYRFMNWSHKEDEVRRCYAGRREAWDLGQVVDWKSMGDVLAQARDMMSERV